MVQTEVADSSPAGVRVVIHASARIQAEITIDGSRWTPIESTPQPGAQSEP